MVGLNVVVVVGSAGSAAVGIRSQTEASEVSRNSMLSNAM